jgi:hypothetical protein
MEKVNVKYVIKRLRHEIFHIVRGINPRSISDDKECRTARAADLKNHRRPLTRTCHYLS